MNLEQLQSLSDSELDRLSATEVMGYHMYHYDKDHESNCYYLLVDGIDAVNPISMFSGFKTEKEAWRDWQPTSNMNQAMELVNEIKGCLHLREHGVEGEWESSFCMHSHSMSHAETASKAITLSSILAMVEVEH